MYNFSYHVFCPGAWCLVLSMFGVNFFFYVSIFFDSFFMSMAFVFVVIVFFMLMFGCQNCVLLEENKWESEVIFTKCELKSKDGKKKEKEKKK